MNLSCLKPSEHQKAKQKSIERNFSKDLRNNKDKNELNEIKRLEDQYNRNNLKHGTY